MNIFYYIQPIQHAPLVRTCAHSEAISAQARSACGVRVRKHLNLSPPISNRGVQFQERKAENADNC